jgi:hypothetical protein
MLLQLVFPKIFMLLESPAVSPGRSVQSWAADFLIQNLYYPQSLTCFQPKRGHCLTLVFTLSPPPFPLWFYLLLFISRIYTSPLFYSSPFRLKRK